MTRSTLARLALLSLAGLLALPVPAAAGAADQVLLVINASSADSVRIGEYYAAKRSIPPDHVLRLEMPSSETIQRVEYLRTIEAPISAALSRDRLQDRIVYVVLTKGVPFRIAGTTGRDGTISSVDSELALLYRKMTGARSVLLGPEPNPYFLGDADPAGAKHFARADLDIYLVTRLDGFTANDAIGLIDRGAAPGRDGKVVLDQRATTGSLAGDRRLEDAWTRITRETPGGAVLERTPALAASDGPVIGYASWGSNDPANQRRETGYAFTPGAIAAQFLSSDGRTFVEPPADWKPGEVGGRVFAGSIQSLAGDLIRDGITGTSAYVAEPYFDATVRPDILFAAYLSGFNLAEAYYLALPHLSWQAIILGDPLCSPFGDPAAAGSAVADAIDPATELPAVFAERRLAQITAVEPRPTLEAARLLLKSEARFATDDAAEGERLLVEAVAKDPKFIEAQLRLAVRYGSRGEFDKAAERYRAILDVDPDYSAAVNDLAYITAERFNKPAEALPLAQRAYRLSRTPLVADTLGWVHHLLDDDRTALPFINEALAGASDNVDVLVHAAFVYSGVRDNVRALRALDAAERIQPAVAKREDVQALRQRLGGQP